MRVEMRFLFALFTAPHLQSINLKVVEIFFFHALIWNFLSNMVEHRLYFNFSNRLNIKIHTRSVHMNRNRTELLQNDSNMIVKQGDIFDGDAKIAEALWMPSVENTPQCVNIKSLNLNKFKQLCMLVIVVIECDLVFENCKCPLQHV